MKITKKQPLRPRGRSDEKRQSTKDAIREAYANGPQKEVQIIPAKKDLVTDAEKKKLRVCAYCRVSTEEDNQASSYELQVQNYTKMIQENPDWEFAGIFADEGISGTSVLHREHFLEMIEKCKAGEIDLIITKQVSRFARNVLDSLNYIFMLRKLDPPVGVYFETEKLNTLDRSSDMVITVLSLVAQSESEQKSNSLKWSFKRRRAQGLGIYPNWSLLGYKGHDWEIDEDEADVVRTIYSLYLEGYSSTQIADLLTKSGILTVKGLSTWSSGSVLGILRNEKYCGDALCQKKFTVDFLEKKMKPNEGEVPQYYVTGSHPAIIEPDEWEQVQAEFARRKTLGKAYSGKSVLSAKLVCEDCGAFFGPKVWHSTDQYRRTIWQCNGKFANEERCHTPVVDTETIQRLFIKAYNLMMQDRVQIIKQCEAWRARLMDFGTLDADIERQLEETQVVAELVKAAVKENASTAQSQEAYLKKYEALTERYEKAAAELERLQSLRTARSQQDKKMALYIRTLKKQPEVMHDWNDTIWTVMIEKAIVHKDGQITFVFQNGTEIKVGA